MVNSASRPPTHAALSGVVSSLWVSHRVGPQTAHVVLPDGRAQIVVDLDAGTAQLVGPRTTGARVPIARTTAGLALTAMGLHRIADVPAHELVDEVIEVDELWGDGRWLRRLAYARSVDELLSGMEQETVRHLRLRAPDPRLVAAERAIRGGIGPGSIATAVGADRRWLVPEFRRVFGVAPKHYQRIVRFQAALRAMRVADPAALATIAASVGYADQAHMCREFTSMAGVAPGRLHGVSSASPNHVVPEVARSSFRRRGSSR